VFERPSRILRHDGGLFRDGGDERKIEARVSAAEGGKGRKKGKEGRKRMIRDSLLTRDPKIPAQALQELLLHSVDIGEFPGCVDTERSVVKASVRDEFERQQEPSEGDSQRSIGRDDWSMTNRRKRVSGGSYWIGGREEESETRRGGDGIHRLTFVSHVRMSLVQSFEKDDGDDESDQLEKEKHLDSVDEKEWE